jgi:outer membrane lipoprotein-sorting protein
MQKILIILASLFAINAFANDEASGIKQVEDYLNGIQSISANFIQTTSDGDFSEGKFYLQRPGKFRWDYKDKPILIVANGSQLIYYDRELEQSNYVPIEDSVASIITRQNIEFSGDIKVTNFKQDKDFIKISFVKVGNNNEGEFSFVFKANPMQLGRIEIVDNSGTVITISLFDMKFDQKLKKSLFIIKDPRLFGGKN